ncbi:MAG: hypothetical protein UHM85_06670 [Acutalibacteraceae bacterium]|nr:hypothetical protein [Acutalibacteraceae bacterium]
MKKVIYVLIVFVLFSVFFAFSDAQAEEIKPTGFNKGTADTVSFSWESSSEADFYYVYRYSSKTGKYELYCGTAENEITADGLDSGKVYYYKVLPIKIDNGRKAPLKSGGKITCVTSPEGKFNIGTEDIGKDYITLKWNKIKGASGYRVYIYSEKKKAYKLLKTTDKHKITVKKLKKDKEYKFIIEAYKSKNGSVAYGAKSEEYKEFTHTDGIPHTAAQVAKVYNDHVNKVKATKNMTVNYTKEIDTEMVFCSKENLAMTVKNIANLYKGVLNKKYVFYGGKSGNITANNLFEPYGKNACVKKDDIELYEVKKTKGGYSVNFTVKKDNGSRKNGAYYDGLLSLKNPASLDTTPLKIRSSDTYFDAAKVSFSVKDNKLKNLTVQGSVLSDIKFEVAKTVADTTVGYTLIEKYKITY